MPLHYRGVFLCPEPNLFFNPTLFIEYENYYKMKQENPVTGFADTFLSKLKEQSFTIIVMVGIIWYQGRLMEERVAYWQKLYEESETHTEQITKENREDLLERIKYLQDQRDKYVEESLNELKNK